MSPKDVLKFCKDERCEFVDIKFTDLPGQWQHITIPAAALDEAVLEGGLGFDGSSVRGWQPIQASDMLVRPDSATARLDPIPRHRTLSLIGDILDPITGQPYGRDPRHVARKAAAHLVASGVADTAYFGPEAEFFVFDDVRYDQTVNSAFYMVDSAGGAWNTGRDERPNLAYKPRPGQGYVPAAPADGLVELRREMVLELQKVGIRVERDHHEVATGGQCEIDIRYAPLLEQADTLQWFKYLVKNVARRNGKAATFMPKPLFGENGSGMHTHLSLWKGGAPLFAGPRYAGLSELALWFVGGLLAHAPALLAFTNPTTNSYRRLVPGFEAPVRLAYSSRNRSAAVRIPAYSASAEAKRVELRLPDGSCNGYLAFAAMLMAGLDGIENHTDPGEPLEGDLYRLGTEERGRARSLPGDLGEALAALEADHAFLLRGNVFTDDLLRTWLEYKREAELQPMRLRPTPYEFALYFDA
jgi:glutamine synthetase